MPWIRFGSTKEEYERWIPEVCGICCLKMIGDTAGQTRDLSLYMLTMKAVKNGTFTVDPATGKINGAYHYPLAELIKEFGLRCQVIRNLTMPRLLDALAKERYVILSIDLAKVNSGFGGGHLVLIYGYDKDNDEVIMHDCASVLKQDGCGVRISIPMLEVLSNRKGLIVC